MSKAALVLECREIGIPIPKNAKAEDIKHRLRHWRPGKGWLFRLARPASRKSNHPVNLMVDWNTVYWVPNSRMSKMIAESNIVFVLGRCIEAPSDAKVLDIPKDFSKRWPLGDKHDSDNDSDS